ncbi:hypothetical protein GCM10023094_00380 [Rhodococcus olei]|uniref:Uncharacterized protein n=1 Tax=Rhodococcus olei TaxID=2161675 RepID=A0ABP8NSY6_9NOCA
MIGWPVRDSLDARFVGPEAGRPERQTRRRPVHSTGVWAVPENIAPGRYAVTAGTGPVTSLRWVQACTDRWCEKPIASSTQYAPEGGGQVYFVVPPDTQAVNNNGVVLTRVE